jgi:hypothetical protein
MSSPTQRTLAECKKRGWVAAIVEKWNPHARIRQDLFGVIDILAITPSGILGIQACAGSSHSARAEKCRAEPRVSAWLGAGASLAVWSWSKRGARGKRKLWALREESISAFDDGKCHCTYEVGSGGPTCACGKQAA